MTREDVTFRSGQNGCAAWLYRPSPGDGPVPCVVMGHGFSLTRHDGLEPYAQALVAAGAAVLVFDHRHLGDSGGTPRQRFRVAGQTADYRAAVDYARTLEGVDPDRIVLWGFSFSGGIAAQVAASDARIAGLLLLCPFLDGLARVRSTSPRAIAWILPRALRDMAGGHTLIPVTAQPGEHGAMTLPGEADGFTASIAAGSPWRNEISAGIFATVAMHRPVTVAPKVRCPVWIGLGERDVSVSAPAIERFSERAPRAELRRYDVDHFEPLYGDGPERIADDQAAWLRRTVVGDGAPATV
ncbi:MAG: alpha/beta hydrolase [Solirubrobacteraceae bacterium]